MKPGILEVSRESSTPVVNLRLVRIPTEVITLISPQTARQLSVVPLYLRQSLDGDRILYVAMSNPYDLPAMYRVAIACGIPVRAMLARTDEIETAIRQLYCDNAA